MFISMLHWMSIFCGGKVWNYDDMHLVINPVIILPYCTNALEHYMPVLYTLWECKCEVSI